MKKILFFVCIAMAMVGCKTDDRAALTDCTEKNREFEEQVNELEMRSANKPEPQSFVIVNNDPNGIHPPAGWETDIQNKGAITVKYDKRYLVDLRLIFKKSNATTLQTPLENTEDVVAAWLKVNDDFINFQESAPLIEAAHIINDPKDLAIINARINDPQNPAKFVVPEININTFLIADNQFDSYMKITKGSDPAGKPTYTPSIFTGFDKSFALFSGPLISIILRHHGTQIAFKFSEFEFRGDPTIIMEIVDVNVAAPNNHLAYYDFTHRPRL